MHITKIEALLEYNPNKSIFNLEIEWLTGNESKEHFVGQDIDTIHLAFSGGSNKSLWISIEFPTKITFLPKGPPEMVSKWISE